MEPFKNHTGVVAVLNRGNVDTDQIIPKEHLKSIRRTGFGEHAFSHWRYFDNGQPNPDFELNRPEFKSASILIAGANFGCGSSREHAVWAIVQAGFKVVLASSFADIFKNNSSKNGLLLLEFSLQEINRMIQEIEKVPGLKADVDLEKQRVTLHTKTKDLPFPFSIEAGLKNRFLEGLDDIGMTEKYKRQIVAFEKKHSVQMFQ